jgi:1,4-alpha-glucan branching enzyme
LPHWRFDGEGAGEAGGIFFYPDARGKTPWGPRPDFSRPEVREYIRDNARMWLDEYRCDGLRWDSTANIRGHDGKPLPEGADLLREVNDAVHRSAPWKIMIAEDLETKDHVTKATSAGGLGFDAQWDAVFFHRIDDTICAARAEDMRLGPIVEAMTHLYNGAATQRIVYTESHDEVANGRKRIPEMIAPGRAGSLEARRRSTLGAAVVMTSPGIPMIFQGQEMLEDGWFDDKRPLDWSKAGTYAGVRALYKDLIALRRNLGGRTRGLQGEHVKAYHVDEKKKVLAVHRWADGGPGDDVVVVLHFGPEPLAGYEVPFPAAGLWRCRFSSDAKRYGADLTNLPTPDIRTGGRRSGAVNLAPYAAVIFSQ